MPLVKRGAAHAPAVAAPDRPYALLLRDLTAADANLRRVAARELAAHPAAAADLCRAVAGETAGSVREAMFTALMRIGTPEAAAHLVPLLDSDDVALRNGAIEALQGMPAGPHIEAILSEDSGQRIFGISILHVLGDGARLIRVIEEDPDQNVCAAAVDALAECGDRAAIVPLERLRERFPNQPFLEFSIRTALAQIASA